MKTLKSTLAVLFVVLLSFGTFAQTEKQAKVKVIKNGTTVLDTLIAGTTSSEDLKSILSSFSEKELNLKLSEVMGTIIVKLDEEDGKLKVCITQAIGNDDDENIFVTSNGEEKTITVEVNVNDDGTKTVTKKVIINGKESTNKTHFISDDDEIYELKKHNSMEVLVWISDDDNGNTQKNTLKTTNVTDKATIEKFNLGNESNQEFGKLKVYPNPSGGEITIKLASKSTAKIVVSVYSISGKQVFKAKLKGATEYNEKLNLSGSEKGTYILKAVQGKQVISRKLIIE